jgi:tetratricopeptide (TPR) repeat protein
LKGDFYNNFAIALKNLGRTKEALSKFEVARYYHQKSHHKIYLGTIENNLAQLYNSEKLFAKAHQATDRGTKIFRQIKDRTREGFSLDTKSQIYFAERKYTQALKTVEKAICILKKSENLAYLVETSLTKSKILLYLDDFTAATLSLFEAVQIARVNTGEEAARDLIKEFEKTLLEKNKIADENLFEEDQSDIDNLKLILPSSISHYTEIQGVWIKNSHLENVGLRKNSLAIVAQTEIKRGDLAAISEIETGAIFCGVYDCDFGIVCLEGANGEPQLFDEKSIKILGKIVGVCNSGKDTDGKMIVQPINL